MTEIKRLSWKLIRPTPITALAVLLVVELILFLADRYRIGCGVWKGYSVLLCCAVVPVALAVFFLWFVICLIFRRRVQFGLASFLLLPVAVALPCGWLAREIQTAKARRADVEWFQERGGFCSVQYDYELSAGTAAASATPPGPTLLRECFGLDFFADVAYAVLWVGEPEPSDVDMEHFKHFCRIKRIDVRNSAITDVGLKYLEPLTELQELNVINDGPPLNNQYITNAGLRCLAGLRKLQCLDLYVSRQVTDAGLENLGELQSLQRLWIDGGTITERGLRHIGKFTNLRFLAIEDTHLTDAGLEYLLDLHDLEHLSLCHTAITDEGLKTLAKLTKLADLHLCGTTISDKGLQEITVLSMLSTLDVYDSKITKAGAKKLHEALPHCTIDILVDPGHGYNIGPDKTYPIGDNAEERQ